MRICIVTSYAAAAEPRAPRHAIAAKRAFPEAEIVFVDLAPASQERSPDPPILLGAQIKRRTVEFPTRDSDLFGLGARKALTRLGHFSFAATGRISESMFGDRVRGLTRALKKLSADAYIAHNIETFLPSVNAAQGRAAVVFDCMEYYSDMGDSQSPIEARAAHLIEKEWLPKSALVIASSDELADTLATEYEIRRPLPAYNVPQVVANLPEKLGGGLNLYWRNSVIGFGQRGLDDALRALSLLPPDVHLYLQGRPAVDGGRALSERTAALGLNDRVTVLPPYAPENAVREAAVYDVGLCLERKGPRNHDLTVSNKMFDYHMGGLAVISSDLPSLRQVIGRSRGGLLYEAGNSQSLADAIQQLRLSPNLLAEMQVNARRFALEKANLGIELDRISGALRSALSPHICRASVEQ